MKDKKENTKVNSGGFKEKISVDDIITKSEGESLKVIVPETRRKKNAKLVSASDLPKRVVKENASKGGQALKEKRLEARSFGEAFEMLSNLELNLKSDKTVKKVLEDNNIKATERQIIAFRQLQMAKTNYKAFATIRDTMGEKPVERQEVQFESNSIGALANKWIDDVDNE